MLCASPNHIKYIFELNKNFNINFRNFVLTKHKTVSGTVYGQFLVQKPLMFMRVYRSVVQSSSFRQNNFDRTN